MLALVAVILAVLAAFNVAISDINLGWLALAFLAADFVVPMFINRNFAYGARREP